MFPSYEQSSSKVCPSPSNMNNWQGHEYIYIYLYHIHTPIKHEQLTRSWMKQNTRCQFEAFFSPTPRLYDLLFLCLLLWSGSTDKNATQQVSHQKTHGHIWPQHPWALGVIQCGCKEAAVTTCLNDEGILRRDQGPSNAVVLAHVGM